LNWTMPKIPLCFNTIPAYLKNIFLDWSISGIPIFFNTIPGFLAELIHNLCLLFLIAYKHS
jgi:hypothetical protein